MNTTRWVAATGALVLLLGIAALAASRLGFVYDLGAFLPPPKTPEQRVLIDRVGQTPGSRFLIVGSRDRDGLVALADQLAESPLFSRVSSDTPGDLDVLRQGLAYEARFLLNDMDWSEQALSATLNERAGELALFADSALVRWIGADPALVTLSWWERQFSAPDTPWVTEDGTSLLLAETTEPAFDLAQQRQAVDQIVQAAKQVGLQDIEISGVGAFGVGLKETIETEAKFRSVVASAALIGVLLLAYRRWKLVLLAALPLLCAGAAGLIVLTLVYGEVHGITLAFGFTLLGVTIDFPLHLFSHSRHQAPEVASRSIRSTLLIGASSTAIAYLAIAFGGSAGLGQLGLFAATGIAVASLVSLYVLPMLLASPDARVAIGETTAPFLKPWLAVIVLLAAAATLSQQASKGLWNNDLASLSPVPKTQLLRDQEFREVLGAPSVRHLVAVEAQSEDASVAQTAVVIGHLLEAVERRELEGFRSGLGLVPPTEQQLRRKQQIPPEPELRRRLAEAAVGSGFVVEQFEPLMEQAQKTRTMPLIKASSYRQTDLQDLAGQFFYQSGNDRFISLVHLSGDISADLGDALAGTPGMLVDLKAASEELVTDYRSQLLLMLGGSLLIIALLLLLGTSLQRGAWALTTTLAAMASCALALTWLFEALSLYHLIGVLLVGGLVLDYALFLSKPGASGALLDSRHAVLACASSTLVAFGILALSGIPALQHLGTAVAVGVMGGFCLARLGVSPVRGGQ